MEVIGADPSLVPSLSLVLFRAVAIFTHAVVGYALVRRFTAADPRIGLLLGIAPDLDFLFPVAWGWPLAHRGLTHTPLFALAVVVGAYAIARDRTVALAVGLAIGSHLVIDSFTPMGIPWLFPLEVTPGPGLGIPVHGPAATVGLWAISIAIVAAGGSSSRE